VFISENACSAVAVTTERHMGAISLQLLKTADHILNLISCIAISANTNQVYYINVTSDIVKELIICYPTQYSGSKNFFGLNGQQVVTLFLETTSPHAWWSTCHFSIVQIQPLHSWSDNRKQLICYPVWQGDAYSVSTFPNLRSFFVKGV